jgi:protein-disulfide isomerase
MRRKPQMTRRSVLTATGAFSLLGIAGVAAGSSSSTVANAPVPDDADSRTYPTMGTNTDAPTARVYGNFKCPVTEEFVFGNLEAIIDEFVSTGRLNLEFRNLAYDPGSTSSYFISDSDPRMAAAGLAVWDEDPDGYWQFLVDIFADRPSGHVSYDDMESRASSAGVSDADSAVDSAETGAYDGTVDQIARTAGDVGISFSPQLELNGETAAPHHDTQSILDWLEARVDEAPAEPEPEADDESEEEEDEESEAETEETDAQDESETDESDDDAEEEPESESDESEGDEDESETDEDESTDDDEDESNETKEKSETETDDSDDDEDDTLDCPY